MPYFLSNLLLKMSRGRLKSREKTNKPKPPHITSFHPAVTSRPARRRSHWEKSRFPGEVVLFEAVSDLLCLSEKLQVFLSSPICPSLLFSLNGRRSRWLDPTQLFGCVLLRRWLALGQFLDLWREQKTSHIWICPAQLYTAISCYYKSIHPLLKTTGLFLTICL